MIAEHEVSGRAGAGDDFYLRGQPPLCLGSIGHSHRRQTAWVDIVPQENDHPLMATGR
jgi:hypothetical protein